MSVILQLATEHVRDLSWVSPGRMTKLMKVSVFPKGSIGAKSSILDLCLLGVFIRMTNNGRQTTWQDS